MSTTPPASIWTRGIVALVAMVMLAIAAVRLPADLADLPGNLIAKKLTAGEPVSPRWLSRVLKSRNESVRRHSTADRWFTIGRAYLLTGDAEKSADGFAKGLAHAPARGIAWAAYANSLEAMGDAPGAAAARRYSVGRAPFDPRAVRLRRR